MPIQLEITLVHLAISVTLVHQKLQELKSAQHIISALVEVELL